MAMKTNIYSTLGQAISFGVDVSKARLELCWLTVSAEYRHDIGNQRKALAGLAEALLAADYRGKIIIESTGYYHWLSVVMLSERGLDVRLVNPLLAHKHHQGGIRKAKTDVVDAFNLASMGLTERCLPPRWDKDAYWVQRRHQVGLIRTMDRVLQQLKGALNSHREALAIMGASEDPMVTMFAEQIQQLECTKQSAQAQLAQAFAGLHEANQKRYTSIPGVSSYVAGLMNLLLRTDVAKAKSWIAYVGLDLSIRQSGSWVGHSKLSKRGMAYLRKKLYQAAWGAMQNDPHFRAYYDKLRQQGHPYVETLLIIARKILRIAFMLQKRKQMYQPELTWT